MADLITVKRYNTRIEAEMAKGFLEANDIKAMITADDEGGAFPFPFQPSINSVQLIVSKKDMIQALDLLETVHNEN